MKIVFDGQTVAINKSGLGYYLDNLVTHLKKIDSEIEIELTMPDKEKDLSTPDRLIWDQWGFPRAAKKLNADIIHKPSFSAPIKKIGRTVVTVHDLIPMIFPENLSFPSRFFYNKILPYSLRYADEIITISECSKNDLIKYLNIDEKKITVIPEAARESFTPIKDEAVISKMKRKYGIKNDYILSVSTIEPRKNMAFLVEVFAEMVKKNPELNYQLVLAGKKGWGFENIDRVIAENDLQNKVVFTGYVADEDMPALYSGATVFAFPSLYEGFGLPPLEAMACGTSVISSNSSSLPEVCEDAAILLGPKDKEGWCINLEKLLTNEKLREQYDNKSIDQSKKFSWGVTAQKTLEVYRKLL